MKKQSIKVLSLIAAAGTLATGCQLLKDVDYVATPNPLEMHGDSVRVKVDITFPAKGIKKKASADIEPMLANTPLKPLRVQGEKATGNGDVILYKAGGKLTYEDVVLYTPDMEVCELAITGKVYKGTTEKGEIDRTKIADGTIITPYLVNKDFKVILAKDNFKRVTEETYMAQINYDKGRSEVKAAELKQDDIKAFDAFLAKAQKNPKVDLKSIKIVGYASPEGETSKNSTLSDDRSSTAKTAMMNEAKTVMNEKAQSEIYSLSGRGEDYDGFKRELEKDTKMNPDEKQLVIRVLEMHKDPETRETEMRNMGKTFTYLDNNIFPLLRRAEITAVYDQTGFSDEELMALSVSKSDTLNLEELLFTATLYTDLNEKLRVYKIAQKRYADDYRTSNNVGAVLYMMNKPAEAKVEFEKANSANDNEITKNNLGAVAGVEGDRSKAKNLLSSASGAGSEVNYNKGILNIQDGDYASAVTNLGSDASFNKALAQLLNGSTADATKTIDASMDAQSAQGYYLKAVAAAREDKIDAVVSNLKSAFAQDASLKAKAMKDREFYKYSQNTTFTTVVQ